MSTDLRATPFHARSAAANACNAWETRNGFTLASHYGDVAREALAARFAAVMVDLSWQPRVILGEPTAPQFASRLFTRDVSQLAPEEAAKALWLNDDAGVRGVGTVVRLDRETFVVISATGDLPWFRDAAVQFKAAASEATGQGMLALVGHMSDRILRAAGLDPSLRPMTLRRTFWRGLDVTLSRLGLGYELWCEPDDGSIVWDRLVAAGRSFALRPAGQLAMDILELENGVVRPGRDFAPAGEAGGPTVQDLGLSDLVDARQPFNGRAAFRRAGSPSRLVGLVFDTDAPMPETPLVRNGDKVGRSLGALHSPAMRQPIGLGVLDGGAPDSELIAGSVPCRAIALPILPIPAPIPPTTEVPPPPV
ncbi:MAG: aminomethyltransferase family protein [Alphaproteobacteria bacterium]|nr:aminomethyltransferase family protein [Alphaproteobacteria bacterium]